MLRLMFILGICLVLIVIMNKKQRRKWGPAKEKVKPVLAERKKVESGPRRAG